MLDAPGNKTSDAIRAGDFAIAAPVKALLGPKYTADMQFYFPDVDPGYRIFGYNVLVQLRMPKQKSKGGIIFTANDKDSERVRTQAALVRAMGPSSFHRRDTLEPWPEGAWCTPGMFVRVPMYGGDRFDLDVEIDGTKDEVRFALFKDTDLIAEALGDVLSIKTS